MIMAKKIKKFLKPNGLIIKCKKTRVGQLVSDPICKNLKTIRLYRAMNWEISCNKNC